MNEIDLYSIAEWIIYNQQSLYEKLLISGESDPETFLFAEATQHFAQQYSIEDLNVAFGDDKILTIIDLFFNRENYEKGSLH